MTRYWVALIEPHEWKAVPRNNPYESLASLHRDAVKLWRLERNGNVRHPRLLTTRQAIDRRVRELIATSESGSVSQHDVDGWPTRRANDADFNDPSWGLGVAGPEEAYEWLMAAAEATDSQSLRLVAPKARGRWAAVGVDVYAPDPDVSTTNAPQLSRAADALVPHAPLLNLTDEAVPATLDDPGTAVLWRALVDAAKRGTAVPMGKAADVAVVESLRGVVAQLRERSALLLRFADGTLTKVELQPDPTLNPNVERHRVITGLMSLRHPELDAQTGFYWFRNEELSRHDRMDVAAVDALRAGLRVLEELAEAMAGRPCEIEVHLTGFHPAIVGLVSAVNSYSGPRLDACVVPVGADGRRCRPWTVGAR